MCLTRIAVRTNLDANILLNVLIQAVALHSRIDWTSCPVRSTSPRGWESSQILSFKAGVDQNIALRASPASGNSTLLICAFPVDSTSFFQVFYLPALRIANEVSRLGSLKDQLVSQLVFWAESTTKDYITTKNDVQFVSYLLCTQVIKLLIIKYKKNLSWHKPI